MTRTVIFDCDRCEREILGSIWVVDRGHLCENCYGDFCDFMKGELV